MKTFNACKDRYESIVALVMGELDHEEARILQEHINVCDGCRSVRDALSAEEDAVREGFTALARSLEPVERSVSVEVEKRMSQTQPADPVPALRVWKGITTMFLAHKRLVVAAALLLIAVGAIVAFHVFPVGKNLPSFTGITFADVQQKMRNIETMSCVLSASGSVKIGEKVINLNTKVKMFSKEPGLARAEAIEDSINPVSAGSYTISDSRKGKSISVFPQTKMYLMKENLSVQFSGGNNFVQKIREMIKGADAKPLGEKTIDGKKAKGYEVKKDNQQAEIWVDAETALPIQIKGKGGFNTSEVVVIMSDIRINEPLDDSLFSMKIPEGYKDVKDVAGGENQK